MEMPFLLPPDANSGDIFAFYMAWKEVDFKTAVTELAERCGQNGTHLSPLAPVSAQCERDHN